MFFDTFKATNSAHGCKDRGLHFNIPHSSLVSLPQILQFVLVREGAEGSIKSALT